MTFQISSSGDQGLPYVLASSFGPGPTSIGSRTVPIAVDDLVKVTTQNLEVVRVDLDRNLLLIKGAVPGPAGGDVYIRPAVKA